MLNHSLLLTQAVTLGEQLPDLFSPFVVCDEAHNLEDAAASVLQYEVSEETVRRLLRAVHDRSTLEQIRQLQGVASLISGAVEPA